MSQLDVQEIVEKMIDEARHKFEKRVVKIVERTLLDVSETYGLDHHDGFVKDALPCGINTLLLSILGITIDYKNAVEKAMAQVAKKLKVTAAGYSEGM